MGEKDEPSQISNTPCRLTKTLLDAGSRPEQGFWKQTENGQKTLNLTPYRGRMYGPLPTLPSIISRLCQQTLRLATEIDHTLKPVLLTHAIMLYYKAPKLPPKSGYMPGHVDRGENDGEGLYPIVSLSLGMACDFLVCHGKPTVSSANPISNPQNLAHRIRLESGDVVVNGGPCRNIWHGIYTMHPKTSPASLPLPPDVRLNVTARYTPKTAGQEHLYSTAELLKSDPRKNRFY